MKKLIGVGLLIFSLYQMWRLMKWKWILPDPWKRISSRFGWRIHPITKRKQFHSGIDIPAPEGTPIYAPDSGVVIKVWQNPIGGLQMRIKHDNGYVTGYAHLSKVAKREGERVEKGEIVAYTGNTGRSTGPHLHLTVRDPKGRLVDPMKMFV